MEDLLKVGVITTTHGIRGEVKVYPTTDADRFLDLEYVLLDTGRTYSRSRNLSASVVGYTFTSPRIPCGVVITPTFNKSSIC